MTNPSLQMLERVVILLRPLEERVVFTGGATIPMYLDDPSTPGIRPTKDVDCVVNIATRTQYYQLEEKLRVLGLEQRLNEVGPICHWYYQDLLLDIMPTEESVLGFNNRWYVQGVQYAVSRPLPSGVNIWIFSSPCLLAAKLDAYQDRGCGDLFTSTDIEDVIAVLDGCTTLEADWQVATLEVQTYLRTELSGLLQQRELREVITGQIGTSGGGYVRTQYLMERIRTLTQR